jgi:hypothetical protein
VDGGAGMKFADAVFLTLDPSARRSLRTRILKEAK